MKPIGFGFATVLLVLVLLLSACGDVPNTIEGFLQLQISKVIQTDFPFIQDTEEITSQPQAESVSHLTEGVEVGEEMLKIQIGNKTLTATLEDNPTVDALKDLLSDGPITVVLQNYGGFEKVGTLPKSLPQDDVQTTTAPGDIMLYQGNSIVIFYDTHAWTYTKLGRITGFSQEELKKILGGSKTTVSLSMIYSDEID